MSLALTEKHNGNGTCRTCPLVPDTDYENVQRDPDDFE